MRRVGFFITISAVAATILCAEDVSLQTVDVEDTGTTSVVKDVAGDEVRSADLADALYKLDPDVQLVRRSGIANDIILRGMRKDNINVLIDGGKIYGGCPNRMDPPISHVLSNNVDHITIVEGPFDVENFGTLTGKVKVDTLEPSDRIEARLNLNAGSWDYYKIGARAGGGTDRIRIMAGGSYEQSGQYEDGDGNTLAEQVQNYAASLPRPKPGTPAFKKWQKVQGSRYAPSHKDMDAYSKKTGMLKLTADVTDNQTLSMSYTINQSDDVLYPNTPMDAKEDRSNLFDAKYTVKNLGAWSKKLQLKFYNSWTYHPMGNYYRLSAKKGANVIENVMSSRIYGGSVKNSVEVEEGTLRVGLDASRRKWNGDYRKNGREWGVSIDHSQTDQFGIFAEFSRRYDGFEMKTGLRFDSVEIDSDIDGIKSRDYDMPSGYLYGTYDLTEGAKIFGGIGTSIRVPDGKELYLKSKPMPKAKLIGNPDLDYVRNNEIDLGIESSPFEDAHFRLKGFYSKLNDFIFYNKTVKRYENRDATLYGLTIDGTYALTDTIYFDGGVAWTRGRKEQSLTMQHGKDMPDITPLKGNLAANWDFDETGTMQFSVTAASGWRDYDGENGEQRLGGYAVFNFKIQKEFMNHLELTLGVDNIADKTYAVTNTYADMTLVTGGDPMLLNEPGRYVYGNLTLKY